jgi:hypothetical protein
VFTDSEPNKVYDLDRDDNYTLILDYGVNTGSGKPDYKLFIPAHLFNDKPYVAMVVVHGVAGAVVDGYGCSDGFEEWGVRVVNRASKSGYKWHDLDADGVWDVGEPGLEGWTIYVDLNDNNTWNVGEPYAETDATGYYKISDITAGTYKVREVLQPGWTCSYPAGGYYEETFVGGMDYTGNNFGNWTTATKSGMKFHDLDADGVKDAGEPGLAGWTIYVDYDNDGVLDAGEPSAVTAADGTYTITGIVPGTWRVKEVAQAGWTQSYPASGYHEETFTSGAALTNNNFGNWQYATKSGYKFKDDNGNGVFDTSEGEVGLAGWTINLWTGSPGSLVFVASTITDVNGYYEFDQIIPGTTYYVSEVIPDPAWIQTFPNSTTAGAMYIDGLGYVWVINLTSGEIHANNNFGNTYYHDETAWAYDNNNPDKSIPFTDKAIFKKPGFNNWGWTNGPYTLGMIEGLGEAGYVLDLYAGAGNNILSNGVLVGHVKLTAVGNQLTIHYTMEGVNVLDEIHLYVGKDYLPKKNGKYTNSPGLFPYDMSHFTPDGSGGYSLTITVNDNFYIAAHAVVRMYEIMD